MYMWWKEKLEVVTNFKWIENNVDPKGGNGADKKFEVYAIIFFWKLLLFSLQKRFKFSFQKEMLSVPRRHHFSYHSLH
jgi:hypothetical protein